MRKLRKAYGNILSDGHCDDVPAFEDDDDDEPGMALADWLYLKTQEAKCDVDKGSGWYSGEPLDLETVKLILRVALALLRIALPDEQVDQVAAMTHERLTNTSH